MDDMNQYLQQLNVASASQSASDAVASAESAKEEAKTQYQRFKQGVVEGVTGPLGIDLLEKTVEKGGLKVAQKLGLGNAFKDWQEGGKGLKGLYNAGKGAIKRGTGPETGPETDTTAPPPSTTTASTTPSQTPSQTPLDDEIAAKTIARDGAKSTLDDTNNSLQAANDDLAAARTARDAAQEDVIDKEAVAGARSAQAVQQAGGKIALSDQQATTAARLAANDARDEAARTQGVVDDAEAEQQRLTGLATQHTADADSAESKLNTAKAAQTAEAEIGDDWETVEPLTAEESVKATSALSDVAKGEQTMAKLTAVSAEDDFNPVGLVITAGLAVGTLFAGIFGHHHDGLPKHPPNAPPVMNASTQFGVAG